MTNGKIVHDENLEAVVFMAIHIIVTYAKLSFFVMEAIEGNGRFESMGCGMGSIKRFGL
jgi:hypothetical protein